VKSELVAAAAKLASKTTTAVTNNATATLPI
jgi:hypothetical protein